MQGSINEESRSDHVADKSGGCDDVGCDTDTNHTFYQWIDHLIDDFLQKVSILHVSL
jgi:hypothetical protein